jgi:ubiquinone/menaquinone biosynthesis C-methylase UbiE
MVAADSYRLGYHDVDGDPHDAVLVANMDATADWRATQRLRSWEQPQFGLAEGERPLEVGCGCGDAAISLRFHLDTKGEMVGVDASSAMLGVARRRSSAVPCAVRFSVGNARSFAEGDQSFGVVRSERTLQ